MKHLTTPFFFFFLWNFVVCAQEFKWVPSSAFPNPSAINAVCLDANFGWCDEVSVGGYSNTGNYPLFKSIDNGLNWTNLGPTPTGTVYSLAQEASTLGTQYAVIRGLATGQNGVYKHTNTTGWQLKGCAGLEPTTILQRNGAVLCGVSGMGNGIYVSTNEGESFVCNYPGVDIYSLANTQNSMYAGGGYNDNAGVLLKSTGYPYVLWSEIANFEGRVIGIIVNEDGDVYVATHFKNLYRSLDGGPFELCRSGINYNNFKIPLACAENNLVLYGDSENGIYGSSDRGETWVEINNGLLNRHIADIRVNPCNVNIVYCVTGNGLCNYIYTLQNFTGMEQIETVQVPRLYPNPVITNLTISLKPPFTLSIYSLLGQLVAKFESNLSTIDLSWLDSGIYFIEICNNVSSEKIKIIKH
jgi:hypothetical protein